MKILNKIINNSKNKNRIHSFQNIAQQFENNFWKTQNSKTGENARERKIKNYQKCSQVPLPHFPYLIFFYKVMSGPVTSVTPFISVTATIFYFLWCVNFLRRISPVTVIYVELFQQWPSWRMNENRPSSILLLFIFVFIPINILLNAETKIIRTRLENWQAGATCLGRL